MFIFTVFILFLKILQATLVEETDSSLIQILGEETIHGKRSKDSGSKDSGSKEEDEALANKGLKAWSQNYQQIYTSSIMLAYLVFLLIFLHFMGEGGGGGGGFVTNL
jgi:hypothetical protein